MGGGGGKLPRRLQEWQAILIIGQWRLAQVREEAATKMAATQQLSSLPGCHLALRQKVCTRPIRYTRCLHGT